MKKLLLSVLVFFTLTTSVLAYSNTDFQKAIKKGYVASTKYSSQAQCDDIVYKANINYPNIKRTGCFEVAGTYYYFIIPSGFASDLFSIFFEDTTSLTDTTSDQIKADLTKKLVDLVSGKDNFSALVALELNRASYTDDANSTISNFKKQEFDKYLASYINYYKANGYSKTTTLENQLISIYNDGANYDKKILLLNDSKNIKTEDKTYVLGIWGSQAYNYYLTKIETVSKGELISLRNNIINHKFMNITQIETLVAKIDAKLNTTSLNYATTIDAFINNGKLKDLTLEKLEQLKIAITGNANIPLYYQDSFIKSINLEIEARKNGTTTTIVIGNTELLNQYKATIAKGNLTVEQINKLQGDINKETTLSLDQKKELLASLITCESNSNKVLNFDANNNMVFTCMHNSIKTCVADFNYLPRSQLNREYRFYDETFTKQARTGLYVYFCDEDLTFKKVGAIGCVNGYTKTGGQCVATNEVVTQDKINACMNTCNQTVKGIYFKMNFVTNTSCQCTYEYKGVTNYLTLNSWDSFAKKWGR